MLTLRSLEQSFFRRFGRPAPVSLLARLAVWLLLGTAVAALGSLLPGWVGSVFLSFCVLSGVALTFVLVPLAWRLTIGRFLWKVRNRLVVTYLLMGLAPVVLFFLLASIAAYIFLGQFAIFAASTELERSLQQLSTGNRAYAGHLAHTVSLTAPAEVAHMPAVEQGAVPNLSRDEAAALASEQVAAFVDGRQIRHPLNRLGLVANIPSVPSWAGDHFHGVAIAEGHLFLRAVDTEHVDGHAVTVISSLPLAKGGVDRFAEGLGRITILPDIAMHTRIDTGEGAPISSEAEEEHADAVRPNTVVGGKLPPPRHFYDLPVHFYAPLPTTDWQTGASRESGLQVTSRPTLLYNRLFITSLQVGVYVQDVLIGVALFFGLIELGAFLMAVRLNRTITCSVSDLYRATLAIDQGELTHRIAVTRRDQLAALSQSFNTMAESLERLLVEQREKERLQGELEIAQQVQANLFPSGRISLPTLEVFGVCQPARTVSGDYYDFLVSGSSDMSFALGDISGKGISAALLMATLHSAVRAYRFAGEDMRSAGTTRDEERSQLTQESTESAVAVASPMLAASFAEPAQILGLLNRHLYRSTQPEKYATLFLAHYDGRTSELIYSTGGQPPPLLLRSDDSVVRLDCGGTVIGLMDRMYYEQGRETMRSGDILIAYSDGVTEPENEFGDFGEDRLVELVRRHRTLPLEQITEHILQALRSWIGADEQPDDITLVLARQR